MAGTRKAKSGFEESLNRLEEIVARLEQGDVPLEESLKLYEEGLTLSRECLQRLNQVETTIKRLGRDMEGNLALSDHEEE
jgi:exodeoxyribonuclease VII small subunit